MLFLYVKYNIPCNRKMFSTVLVCFVAVTSIITVSTEKKYNNQSEIFEDMIDQTFACLQELDVNPDVCTDLLMKEKDHDDKKYDNCKCLGPCIGKKMGTMNKENGKWNWARIKELSNLMETDIFKNETKILESACYDEVNTHCEAGFAFMKCILKNSQMAQDMAKNFLAAKDVMKNEDENN